MDRQRVDLSERGASDARKVPASAAPVSIVCPLSLQTNERAHLVSLLKRSDRPRLLLCLFFIHGHELLAAAQRGQGGASSSDKIR